MTLNKVTGREKCQGVEVLESQRCVFWEKVKIMYVVADAFKRTQLFSPPVGGVKTDRTTTSLNKCCVHMGCKAHTQDSLS
jgi:hypothetical protein